MALKYEQIKDFLKDEAIKPESAVRMPSVRELMRRFNVSLATVNRALSELEHDEIIVRRQGAGIVAAGNSRSVASLGSANKRKERHLVFAYIDYPDENIWRTIHSVSQYARQHQCSTLDCKIYQDTATEAILEFVRSQKDCDGVILLLGSDRMSTERLEALGKLETKVVIVDSMSFYADFLPDNLYVISPDAADSAEKTAEMLLRNGHRHIGYIRNEPRTEYSDLHLKAFCAAMKRAGVEFGPDNIFSSTIRSWENSMDAAVQQTRTNIATIRRLGLTALVYKSSSGALVSVKALQELGFDVPGDISVTGEGERSLYPYLSPGLTVVTPNYSDMARTAVDIVLGNVKPKERNMFFPHSIIERNSVKDINSKQ